MRVASTYSLGVAMLLVLSLLAPSARARFQAPQTPQDVPAPPSAEQKPGTAAARFIPAQLKLRTFHTIFVHSDTVYLKTEDLRNTVMNRVEMHGWKIDVAGKGIADVLVIAPQVRNSALGKSWRGMDGALRKGSLPISSESSGACDLSLFDYWQPPPTSRAHEGGDCNTSEEVREPAKVGR
jgi:hypothetical protein